MGSQHDLGQPANTNSFSAILFDMDGTLVDTTPAVEHHWHRVGKEIGVDGETILKTAHGRRTIDTLKTLAPERANWESVRDIEAKIPELYGHLAQEIPGAHQLLESVAQCSNPWAIVTSATKPLASRWIEQFSLPAPDHLFTAELVENGKPDPACYRMALERLGLADSAADALVVEDSPAGIFAGKMAGCRVLALLTTHTMEQVLAAGPDWVVKDLESVMVVASADGKIELGIVDEIPKSRSKKIV